MIKSRVLIEYSVLYTASEVHPDVSSLCLACVEGRRSEGKGVYQGVGQGSGEAAWDHTTGVSHHKGTTRPHHAVLAHLARSGESQGRARTYLSASW